MKIKKVRKYINKRHTYKKFNNKYYDDKQKLAIKLDEELKKQMKKSFNI